MNLLIQAFLKLLKDVDDAFEEYDLVRVFDNFVPLIPKFSGPDMNLHKELNDLFHHVLGVLFNRSEDAHKCLIRDLTSLVEGLYAATLLAIS